MVECEGTQGAKDAEVQKQPCNSKCCSQQPCQPHRHAQAPCQLQHHPSLPPGRAQAHQAPQPLTQLLSQNAGNKQHCADPPAQFMQAQNIKVQGFRPMPATTRDISAHGGDTEQLCTADATCCPAARLLLPFTKRIGLQRGSRSRTGTGRCCSTWDAASDQLCWGARAEATEQHHSSRCARSTHKRNARAGAHACAGQCLWLPASPAVPHQNDEPAQQQQESQ